MTRGPLLATGVAAAALLVPASLAPAAGPSAGTISRGWMSARQHGAAFTIVPAGTKTLIANFVWKTPPSPGQALAISWVGPNGQRRAVWTNRTLKSDRPGTRLWTSIGRNVFSSASGTWRVKLLVGKKVRGTLTFQVR
jgi:hypothetical protein